MAMDSYLKDLLRKPKKDRTPEDWAAINKGMIDLTGQRAGNLVSAAGMFGNIMSATSDMPGQEPNVKQSAIGGALSGFSSGMAFGPMGALLGAGIGGVGGFLSGSKNLEEHLLQMNQEQEANMASKTIQPNTFKPGGIVGQEGIQTEVGEVTFIPELMELVLVAANKLHKDMDSKLVTDFFPKGSMVLSNKKMFDPKKISDKVLGYGQGHYSENKTYAPERIIIGDKFGDKKLTYADAAKKLKKSISVTDGKKKDIFDDITDAENKLTRMMYLQELINSQENIDTEKLYDDPVQKFEYGGTVGNVPKFLKGGPVGGCPPGFFKPKGSSTCIDIKLAGKGGIGASSGGTDIKGGYGSPVGVGVSGDYYKNVLEKLQELRNTNKSELDKGKSDLNSLSGKLRGSIMAQAGVASLFTALQNPRTTPVIQDNTFIEDAYQQIPQSLIESQVSPIRGSVNSMAQMLLSSGVDPSRVPSMLASSQGRALDAEGRMRSGFIEDRISTDRSKYAALRDNLTTNKSNLVAAENETNEGYNQRYAQFGSILSEMMGSQRELTAGKYEAGRNLDKSFLDNDISLFQTETGIEGNRMEFDDNMRRINERLESLRSENSRRDSEIERRNMFTTKMGVDENGRSVSREVPNVMKMMSMLSNKGITPPQRGVTNPSNPNILELMKLIQMNTSYNAPNTSTYW